MTYEVVPMDLFRELLDYSKGLEKRIALLERKQLAGKYCSREQAMTALGVCATTLKKLDKQGIIISEKGARKVRYDVDSLRNYLDSRRMDSEMSLTNALR